MPSCIDHPPLRDRLALTSTIQGSNSLEKGTAEQSRANVVRVYPIPGSRLVFRQLAETGAQCAA